MMTLLLLLLLDERLGAADETEATPPKAPAEKRPADEPEKRVRQDLIVTATRSERTAADLPVSATVLTRADIREAPVHSVDEIVRTIPGLNLPLSSSLMNFPTNHSFSLRGVGANRGLVLLDGIPINDPFIGTTHWNKVPLSSVERIEVVRGGGSSLFGNLALGGTLQLVSRRIEDEAFSLDLSGGSYETVRGSGRVDHRVSPNVALSVSVDAYRSGGYIRTVPEERSPIDEPYSGKAVDAQVRADLGRPDGARGFVKANYYRNHLTQGTPLGFNRRRIADVAASGTTPLGEGGELSASAFALTQLLETDNAAFQPNSGNSAEYLSASRETPSHDAGGSLLYSRLLTGIVASVSAGVDVRQMGGEDRGQEFDRFSNPTVYRNAGGTQRFVGGFLQASLIPSIRMEILVSARLDTWRSFNGRLSATPGSATELEAVSRATFDPRLSVRYSLAEGLSARAGVYRAFRAPTLQDLYRLNQTRTQLVIPNPYLGPETMVGGEIGLDFARGSFSGQVNVFQNQVDNQIVRYQTATAPIATFEPRNVGASRSRGVEVMGEVELTSRLSLDGGYTLTNAVVTENRADASLEGKNVTDVSRHFGSGSVKYRLPSGFLASFRARAWSRRFTDAANQLPLAGGAVFDLLLSYPVLKGLDVSVTAENILDRRYVADSGGAGRRIGEPLLIYVGLRWSAGRSGFRQP